MEQRKVSDKPGRISKTSSSQKLRKEFRANVKVQKNSTWR
jgi:hypothetical protein